MPRTLREIISERSGHDAPCSAATQAEQEEDMSFGLGAPDEDLKDTASDSEDDAVTEGGGPSDAEEERADEEYATGSTC